MGCKARNHHIRCRVDINRLPVDATRTVSAVIVVKRPPLTAITPTRKRFIPRLFKFSARAALGYRGDGGGWDHLLPLPDALLQHRLTKTRSVP